MYQSKNVPVAPSGPRICSPSCDNGLLWSRNICRPKNAFKDGDASTNDDVIGDVLHDSSSFTGNKSEENGGFVEIPEEEKFTSRRSCASDVSKQVACVVPENPKSRALIIDCK